MRCHLTVLLCSLLASTTLVQAQSRKIVIVVIGSSTAEGVGANPIDSSWVRRTQYYYRQLGEIDTIYNIALGGQTTYSGMPSGFKPPLNRPLPDTATNITKALSYHPDIVLVSFPTNDAAADYTLTETMANLRTIYKKVRATGKVCYIATSQPRSSIATVQQELLKTMRDSVVKEFRGNSLNFYNPIVASDSLNINPVYNFDGTHVNDAGHRQLFLVVKATNILAQVMPLALTLLDFSAEVEGQNVVLHWDIADQTSPASFVVQRSKDGTNYSDVWQEPAATVATDPSTLSWTDNAPLPGNSYYRLEYTDGTTTDYSEVVDVNVNPPVVNWGIGKLYTAPGTSNVQAEIMSPSTRNCTISVLNTTGQLVYRQVTTLSPPWVMISIPTSGWAAGEYFLRLVTDQGDVATKAFLKF